MPQRRHLEYNSQAKTYCDCLYSPLLLNRLSLILSSNLLSYQQSAISKERKNRGYKPLPQKRLVAIEWL